MIGIPYQYFDNKSTLLLGGRIPFSKVVHDSMAIFLCFSVFWTTVQRKRHTNPWQSHAGLFFTQENNTSFPFHPVSFFLLHDFRRDFHFGLA